MFVSRTSPRRLAGLTRSSICLASRPPPLPPSPLARVANPNIPFAHSGLKKSALLSSRDSDVATLRARPQIVAPTRSHQIAIARRCGRKSGVWGGGGVQSTCELFSVNLHAVHLECHLRVRAP
jgi:hypothetical protein